MMDMERQKRKADDFLALHHERMSTWWMMHPRSVCVEAIDRGNAYKEAGADCIFVPDVGGLDKKAIATLVKEIDAPLNIVAGATTPPMQELQDMGVARVSVGPRPMRAVLSLLRKIAKELTTTGTYELMSESSITYSEVNQWFTR